MSLLIGISSLLQKKSNTVLISRKRSKEERGLPMVVFHINIADLASIHQSLQNLFVAILSSVEKILVIYVQVTYAA